MRSRRPCQFSSYDQIPTVIGGLGCAPQMRSLKFKGLRRHEGAHLGLSRPTPNPSCKASVAKVEVQQDRPVTEKQFDPQVVVESASGMRTSGRYGVQLSQNAGTARVLKHPVDSILLPRVLSCISSARPQHVGLRSARRLRSPDQL